MFDLFHANKGDISNLDNLLIDYDTLKNIIPSGEDVLTIYWGFIENNYTTEFRHSDEAGYIGEETTTCIMKTLSDYIYKIEVYMNKISISLIQRPKE